MPAESEVLRLYDEHASRLYAVAIRILGDRDAAAEVLESVFVDAADVALADFASLLRATRDAALARLQRAPRPPSEPPSSRVLVERAFFEGLTVTELAAAYSLDEERVRAMLRDGMGELRRQFAESGVR